MEDTPLETGVDAAPEETPVRRRKRASKPRASDPHEMVRVRNLTRRKLTTPSGNLAPGGEGEIKRLDANRLSRYVEVL